jgi:hypothetical protein
MEVNGQLHAPAWRRPHRKHVSRVRLRVHWSVSSTGRGADDIENTASSIFACWTVFTEMLPGNALLKSVNNNKNNCSFDKESKLSELSN